MKSINRTITLAGALAFAVMATACGNTADGAKKDANNMADKTAEAAATTGDAMSGAAETSQIKTALLADTRLNATDINVDTDETKKTVTLRGTVPTDAEKIIAAEIATSKAAGYTVMNDLTIKPNN